MWTLVCLVILGDPPAGAPLRLTLEAQYESRAACLAAVPVALQALPADAHGKERTVFARCDFTLKGVA